MAKKKKSNRPLVIIGIVLVVVIVIMVGGRGIFGGPKLTEVEVGEAKPRDIIERKSASGTIQPITEVKLSPDVAGEIIDLRVKEGDSVVVGDTLIRIRPDNLESILDRSEANLKQQRANLADARARSSRAQAQFIRDSLEFVRRKELYDKQVISKSDFELAQANFTIAKNDLLSARQSIVASTYVVESAIASVDEAKENVRLTIVTAPMSGTVSKLSVEKGERVVGTQQMAGTEMLRIANLNAMEVRVDVNENDIIKVSLNDTADIDVDAYAYLNTKFKGIVTSIANTANDKASADAVTEFEVRIKILNAFTKTALGDEYRDKPFRPGMTAAVDIITEVKNNVLSVPLSAVTTRFPDEKRDRKKKFKQAQQQSSDEDDERKKEELLEVVFVLEEGKAIMKPVQTRISDYDNIEVLSGVAEGAVVITGPYSVVSKNLYQDDLVKVKDEDKKGKDTDDEPATEE